MRARAEREITRGPGGNHRGLFSVWRARRAEAQDGPSTVSRGAQPADQMVQRFSG